MASIPSNNFTDRGNPPPGAPKLWRVGALTYTTGALILLCLWLLGGDFALSVRDRAIPPVMQILFKKFHASNMVTGLIFSSIPSALGLFISPIVAYRSDRLRSPWGRRIPFMIVPVPFIVFTTAGLAFSPQLGQALSHFLGRNSPGAAASTLIVMAICWTVFEVGCIVTYAVLGALMKDVVPQEVMGRFYGFYRAVSLIVGMLFFFNVIGEAKQYFTDIFLGIGLIYGIAFTVMCLMVKEGPPPEVIDAAGPHPGVFGAVKTYFRDGFGKPYYLCFFAASILGALGSGPFNQYSIYYSENIGLSDADYGRCIGWSYGISLALSIPIGMAADYFHPLRLTIAMLFLYGLTLTWAGLFVHDPASFGAALIAHTVISGSLFTSWASLPQRLLPRARFAEIGSAGGIIGSIVGIFFIPCVGRFLDAMHDDYRYTFYIGAGLTFAALIAYLVLHRLFMALGGPKNYVAPE